MSKFASASTCQCGGQVCQNAWDDKDKAPGLIWCNKCNHHWTWEQYEAFRKSGIQAVEEQSKSILAEAEQIINGPRRDSYGPADESFKRIAKGWSVLFGVEVTSRQVALAMIWLKVCRDANKPARDNLTDIAGYAGLAEKL
jgi:hypothetical protein